MRKKRTKKVFLKAFKITNKEGNFTKEDFERLQEKFEIIRKLYFYENENHDYYDSFRTITKEIKRAAHNAGLTAEIINLDYNYKIDYIKLDNPELTTIEFNIYILIKSAAKFTRQDDFVITTVQGFSNPIKLYSSIDEGYSSFKAYIDDDMDNELEITYCYKE